MWSFVVSVKRRLKRLRSEALQGLAVLLAGQCCCCGLASDTPYPLCSHCSADLPRVDHPCGRCGLSCVAAKPDEPQPTEGWKESNASDAQRLCSGCLLTPLDFDRCHSAFAYRSPIDKLVSGFKFNARSDNGAALSEQLCRSLRQRYRGANEELPWPSAVVAVPLHPTRLRQRGFNQAEEIGKRVCHRLKLSNLSHAVYRPKQTAPQTELVSARERGRNLNGAFAVRLASELAQHEHIAIVDDVVTTGSTVAELARTLRRVGVRRIDVWCLARAE